MELVLLGVIHFQVCSIFFFCSEDKKKCRNVHVAVQVYVPTPADFLPRICRAALRPSKEFLETCSYLVKWNHAIHRSSHCKTLRWTVTCTMRRTHRSCHHFFPRPRFFRPCCFTTSPPTQRRTGMLPLLPWTWTNCGRHHCNSTPCTL